MSELERLTVIGDVNLLMIIGYLLFTGHRSSVPRGGADCEIGVTPSVQRQRGAVPGCRVAGAAHRDCGTRILAAC